MADGGDKRDKHEGDDPGVLSSLPATRPSRLSRRATAAAADAPSATKAETAAAKAKPAGRSKPAKKVATAKPKAATGTAAKDAARTAGSKAKAPAKAKPAPAPPAPVPLAAEKPRPVRAASPELAEPIEKAAEQRPGSNRSGNPVEQVVRTATGVVKGILARLPRP
jgi:hypothetical protein